MEVRGEYLGLQPLVDRQQRLIGYRVFGGGSSCAELLARFKSGGPDQRMLFYDIGVGALDDPQLRDIDPARCVLSLTGAPGNPELATRRVQAMRTRGVRLSIADASPGSPWLAHIGVASYSRIDVASLPDEHLARYALALKRRGTRVIATGLGNHADFRRARAADIELFEGYWFNRIDTGESQAVAPVYGAVMRALALVRSEAPFREIEQVIRADPTLAFRLLRYVNSASFALATEIGSITDAIALLGYRPLGRWLGLSLVTAKVDAGVDATLALNAIRRGRLMELIKGGGPDGDDSGEAFMVGLCSLLDALLDMPIERVVEKLVPPPAVAQALIGREGSLGHLLQLVESCEHPALEGIDALATQFGLSATALGQLQVDSMGWAERQLH